MAFSNMQMTFCFLFVSFSFVFQFAPRILHNLLCGFCASFYKIFLEFCLFLSFASVAFAAGSPLLLLLLLLTVTVIIFARLAAFSDDISLVDTQSACQQYQLYLSSCKYLSIYILCVYLHLCNNFFLAALLVQLLEIFIIYCVNMRSKRCATHFHRFEYPVAMVTTLMGYHTP